MKRGSARKMDDQSQRKRTKTDKYSCPVNHCNATYTRRHNLKTHFRKSHAQLEKDFPQVFVTLKSTKEGKTWKCPVDNCLCGYSRKGDLKYHFIRKHHELASKYPSICKSKSSKQNKKHLCPIEDCACGYLRKTDLKAHFISKHQDYIHLHPLLKPRDVVVQCRFCSESFQSGEIFAQHLSLKHDINSLPDTNRSDSSINSYDEDHSGSIEDGSNTAPSIQTPNSGISNYKFSSPITPLHLNNLSSPISPLHLNNLSSPIHLNNLSSPRSPLHTNTLSPIKKPLHSNLNHIISPPVPKSPPSNNMAPVPLSNDTTHTTHHLNTTPNLPIVPIPVQITKPNMDSPENKMNISFLLNPNTI
jgi:hypothetical protein